MSDTPTVFAALSAVMEEVQAVGKTGRNTQQNYNFRGVDAVVNAVGPVLRKHGVIVVPISAGAEVEHYDTKSGTSMRNVTLTVGFRFYGPAGDYIEAMVCGESADSGDKAVPKAHSVAYRTLLLQALCIPTDEPDPDSQSNERGSQATGARADSRPATQPAGSPNGKKKPEQLAYLSEMLATLKSTQPGTDWAAEARNVSIKFFGKERSQELTKVELDSLVTEVEKWLAHLEPGVPFG